jgi:Bacterial Ig domain/RTX calcium-binding nonapeptide repeat (4 copies)
VEFRGMNSLSTKRLGCTVLVGIVAALAPTAAAHAATVASDGVTATFTADAGEADRLDVKTIAPDTVEFENDGDTLVEGANCTEVSTDTSRCTVTARVIVDARDGNDFVRADEVGAQAVRALGGDGNDLLLGGLLADELRGGAGNDTLHGSAGGVPAEADLLDGGPDDDTFFQPAGADDVIGGTGSDRLTVLVGNVATFPIEPASMSITLDDVPNDLRGVDGANVHADVEHIGSYLTSMMEDGFDTGWTTDLTYYDEGSLTARGTEGPNSLQGATDADDLNPLAGNDSVSAGYGDDRVNVVDGYADRVVCGPGTDTVTADTLDVVSESCEIVQRTDAGNANDVPEVPEDAPPAVTLAAGPTLTADATDDRGIAAVMFLDDDRLVCSDDTAPYTCEHQPRGEDVGRNTITAIAVDTVQQTASDRRVVTVPRFAPAGVTLRATPRRASGRVLLPAQVTPALGCRGTVSLKPRSGRARRVRVKPDCTFAARVRLRRRTPVQASFAGNDVLAPAKRAARVR